MKSTQHRTTAVILAATVALSGRAHAQFLELRGGRAFMGPAFSAFALGYAPVLWGPFSLGGSVSFLDGPEIDLYGAGAEAGLNIGPSWRALIGGSAGFSSGTGSGDFASWTIGVGYDLFRNPFSLGAEARYRTIGDFGQEGFELNLRVAIPVSRSRAGPRAPVGAGPEPSGPHLTREAPPLALPAHSAAPVPAGSAAEPLSSTALVRAREVVDMALLNMGTPYLWGGSNANGFDCSGLIQHAYAGLAVALPRTSAQQARAGRPVEPRLDRLEPGDILVFGSSAEAVTHVGLYIGDGSFIHSSRTGVRSSRLSQDDPDGRWWLDRWVGARRVLQ